MKQLILVSLFLLPASWLCAENPSSDWTQWRGNNRDSVAQGTWPTELSPEKLKVVWSKSFGPSYSGPIVLGDTVFTTETRNEKDEVVFALDRKTGEKKWSTEWTGAMKVPFFAAKNGSWIRATPATDGKRLYVAGMLGKLVCLDVKTGDEVWSVDFAERYGVARESFGHVCSPLIIEQDEAKDPYMYIQCNAGFLKMNRLTGEEVWRVLDSGQNMMSSGAFSSPFVATVAGKKQILVQTRTDLAGVDIESGKVLWKQPVPNFRGMNILTPTVYGDMVFTSSYNHRSFGFGISKDGNGFAVEEKWTAPSKAYMSSPVIIGDDVYMHLQSKRIASINLKTGETNWVSRTKKRFGDYWSMVSNGNQILALDSRGILYLMKANPKEFELIGEAKLDTNDSWAHLAIVDNLIYVRGLDSLVVYEWSK